MAWAIAQQAVVRGLLALKLILAARMLGPTEMGQIGVALLCVAVAEGISDTGIAASVVQNRRQVNSWQAGALWTFQVSRGLALAVGLFASSQFLANAIGVDSASSLIAVAAVLPLIRNSINPGLIVLQRKRNFRSLLVFESIPAFVDIALTLAAIGAGLGAEALLIGFIAADSVRLLFSWTWARVPIRPSVRWRLIDKHLSFGKWVWGSSVLTVLINQFDKFIVAKLLGPIGLGIYQISAKVAQIALSDGAVALGAYLYPTLSNCHRESPLQAKALFVSVLKKVVVVACVVAIALSASASAFVEVVLGKQWIAAVGTLKLLAFAAVFGAVIAVVVPYLRARGAPQAVTRATLVQFAILVPASIWLASHAGPVGAAIATVVSGGIATVVLLHAALRDE